MWSSRALSTDAPCQLDVLGHDGDALGVDRAQIGVFKETYKVSLSGLLESQYGRALKAKIALEILGDLTHQTLERKLTD